jgi:hypothetical protein
MGFDLLLIFFTIIFQSAVMLRIKQYLDKGAINLFFLHPAFYINLPIILFFFIPLIFYKLNKSVWFWTDVENISKPLIIFCIAVIILNLLFLSFKRFPHSVDLNKILDAIKRWLPILIIFYSISWFTRILFLFSGLYMPGNPEMFREFSSQHPFFMPVFMLFNMQLYFPVVVMLWLLTHTVFASNKRFNLYMKILLFADVIYFLPTGGKQGLLQPIFAYIFSKLILKKRIALKKIIVFIVLFSLFLPAYNAYRVTGGNISLILEAIMMHNEAIYGEQKGYYFTAIEAVFRRVEAFASYIYFTQMDTGGAHLKGATYIEIISRLLPEFFLPLPQKLKEKPLTDRLIESGLIGEGEYMPAGSLAPWGEMYINFGYWGVVFGLPLLGILSLYFLRTALSPFKFNWLFVYLFVPYVFLVLTQSGIANLITPLINITIVLLIANLIFKSPRRI